MDDHRKNRFPVVTVHDEFGPWPLYVLHPGHLISANDGQWHYFSARKLADLYGVDMRECVTAGSLSVTFPESLLAAMTHLRPRSDGNYTLPNKDRAQ
jgi:hypothetical protein